MAIHGPLVFNKFIIMFDSTMFKDQIRIPKVKFGMY